MNNVGLICVCGFKFAGPGEFRNCEAFVTGDGKSGVICPECGREYVEGKLSINQIKPKGTKNENQNRDN